MVSLGLDITGFKNSSKVAVEQAKATKRSFGDMKDVFAAGGATAAVIGFFRAAIAGAENAADKTDKNVAAVLRWRDALRDAKSGLQEVAVSVTGTLNRMGEWVGRQAAILIHGREQVELNEQIEAQTAETVRNLEEAKKHQAEFESITKSLERIETQRTELQQKGLTAQERANVLENEYLSLLVQRENFSGTAIERRRLELETAEALLAFEKAQAEVAKEQAASDKKAQEDAAKAAEKRVKLEERKAQLTFERLSLDEKIEKLAMRESTLQEEIRRGKIQGRDVVAEEVELLELQTQLNQLREQQAQRIAKAESDVAREIAEQNKLFDYQINLRAGIDQQLSDRELREKVQNLNNQRFELRQGMRDAGQTERAMVQAFVGNMLDQEYADASDELRKRRVVRENLARYGGDEEMAYQRSGLSASDFERIVGIVGSMPEQEKQARRTTELLEKIERKLPDLIG